MNEAIRLPPASDDLDQLARLLVDAVDSGVNVSFMRALSVSDARICCSVHADT